MEFTSWVILDLQLKTRYISAPLEREEAQKLEDAKAWIVKYYHLDWSAWSNPKLRARTEMVERRQREGYDEWERH